MGPDRSGRVRPCGWSVRGFLFLPAPPRGEVHDEMVSGVTPTFSNTPRADLTLFWPRWTENREIEDQHCPDGNFRARI